MHLRPLKKRDRSELLALMRDEETTRFLPGDFASLTREDVDWFIQSSYGDGSALRLAVVDGENAFCGMASIKGIDHVNRRAELDLVLTARARGTGAAAEAAGLLLSEAFDTLFLHSVYCDILERNVRALRLFDRLGFRREGLFREAVNLRGEMENVVRLSVLEHEYRRGLNDAKAVEKRCFSTGEPLLA